MRLGRGTGLAGLAGIAPRRGRWIRPLLAATRAEIEADLETARVPWREDASNRDRAYTRNRVRHDVVPALIEALGGRTMRTASAHGSAAAARAGLARRAAAALSDLGEVSRWLDAKARRIVQRIAHIESTVVVLPAAPLRGLPRALRLAVIRQAWRSVGREGLRRAHLDALDRAIASTAPKGPIRLPGGVVATARAGELNLVAGPSGAQAARHSAAGEEARCQRDRRWGTVAPRRTR
jgi:tRNA(Ile)-lysidine synthase